MDPAPRILRKVVLLAGGVGGARMAEGLAGVLSAETLTVIGNIGDDETFYGLYVSPDIDTLLYTLSGRIDRSRGWGVAEDSTQALSVLTELGAPNWMTLGDKDLGLHIWRSWRLAQGATLTEVTEEACRRLGAGARIVPATDDRVRTQLRTEAGWMDFQTWFVREKCGPTVFEIRYAGVATARPTATALAAIGDADAIVFAPNNPLLSIHPILALPGMRLALNASRAPRIAVSPLIGGKAIKGPLDRLMRQLGHAGGTRFVLEAYAGMIDGLVIDRADAADAAQAMKTGPSLLATDILIPDPASARALAKRILAWVSTFGERT